MLLERDGLLAKLDSALGEAAAGSGRLLLVSGEAGSGKSTLLQHFAGSLGRGTLLIEGACDPLTTPRPLSPLHDFAADPESGIGPIGDRDRIDVFNEVLDRLTGTIRPVVVIIEDTHWADEGTLDFLRFIGRRIAGTKSIVIATYRGDEVGADHPLRSVLGQVIPLPSTYRFEVNALSERAVATLAQGSSIDPSRLYRLTGGNAFYVTEVLATGQHLPSTVQEAVLARVGRLPGPTRRAVEAVSIAPRSLELERVATLVEVPMDSVDAAVGAGVLFGDGVRLRFRHELARAAVEASIPPGRRLGMHRRMIAMLEGDNSPDTARLAHHAIQAGSADLIVKYAPTAGWEAVARGARREAATFFEAALDHLEELGPDRTASIRVALARQLRLLDDMKGSEDHLRHAITYFTETADPHRLADALGHLGATLWGQHRIQESWEATAQAVDVLRPHPEGKHLAIALYRAAENQMLARHAEPAMAYIEEARRVSQLTDDRETSWLVEMMTGCVQIVSGNAPVGSRILKDVVSSAKKMGKPHLVSLGLGMLGTGAGEARLYQAAIPALEEGIEQGLSTDEDYRVSYNRAWMARIAFERGRWDDAAYYADLVDRTTQEREGIAYLTGLTAMGRVRVRRGDPGGLELLDRMIAIGEQHELQHSWNAICGRAEGLWLTGRGGESREVLADAYERALQTDSQWARGEIGFWMWRVGAIDTPPPGTAQPYDLQIRGDWVGAAEAWRQIGCPYEVALALLDGDPPAVTEAFSMFDSLGAAPAANLARNRLREMGAVRVPRGPNANTRMNPHGLTHRQMEVLELLGQGLSNAEIAQRLFISKKTVENHVSAIFVKLGVSDRAAAVRQADSLT